MEYQPADRADWRRWLAAHHSTSPGVWLIWHSRRTGRQQITLDEAVREALCFGWIDSRLRPLGDGRSALLFTPRRPKSTWSRLNKQRVQSLVADGLVTDAGLRVIEAAKRDGSWDVLNAVEELRIPDDLARALAASPEANAHFQALPPSTKKTFLWWIQSARRPETRARRVAETVRGAAESLTPRARNTGANVPGQPS